MTGNRTKRNNSMNNSPQVSAKKAKEKQHTPDAETAKILQELDDPTYDRYDNDEEFRKNYGPNLDHYGNAGMDFALIGLTMKFDFGSYGKDTILF